MSTSGNPAALARSLLDRALVEEMELTPAELETLLDGMARLPLNTLRAVVDQYREYLTAENWERAYQHPNRVLPALRLVDAVLSLAERKRLNGQTSASRVRAFRRVLRRTIEADLDNLENLEGVLGPDSPRYKALFSERIEAGKPSAWAAKRVRAAARELDLDPHTLANHLLSAALKERAGRRRERPGMDLSSTRSFYELAYAVWAVDPDLTVFKKNSLTGHKAPARPGRVSL